MVSHFIRKISCCFSSKIALDVVTTSDTLQEPISKPRQKLECAVISVENLTEENTENAVFIESGAHGKVSKIILKDGREVSCKKYKDKKTFGRGLNVLRRMKNTKRLQNYLFHVVKDLCIYNEYIPGSDLYYYLINRSEPGTDYYQILDNITISQIGREILLGLNELKSYNLVHLDLKPENLIVCEKNGEISVKLIDFDTARPLYSYQKSTYLKNICGTEQYISPEIFNNSYHQTTDIWSLGVILWLLKTGSMPYNQDLNVAEIDISKYYRYKIVMKDVVFYDLMCKMLNKNPNKRITIKEALKHPYFTA